MQNNVRPVTIVYNMINPASCDQKYTFDTHEQALIHLLGRDVCLKSVSQPVEPSPPLSEQVLQDIMTGAVEGGINYWAKIRNLVRDSELNVISFDVKDAEDPSANWEHIDADRVQTAINHIVEGNVEVVDSIVKGLKNDIASGNWGIGTDADTYDVIIQIAAFDEIVYR